MYFLKKAFFAILFSTSLLFASSTVSTRHKFDQIQTVEATGYANSEDEALKNAFKNAVEQSVGVLVDSSTIIRNQQLIKNEILTFSNGFIEKYNLISKKKDLDLWEITISAIVKQQDVLEKIKVLNIQTKEIENSDQVYAQAVSSSKAKFDGENLLHKFVIDTQNNILSKKYIKWNVDNLFINIDEATKTTVPITIDYTMDIDWDEYAKIVSNAEKLFSDLGATKVSIQPIATLVNIEEIEILDHIKGLTKTDIVIVSKKNNTFFANIWRFPKSYQTIKPFSSETNWWFSDQKRLKENKSSFTFTIVISDSNNGTLYTKKMPYDPYLYPLFEGGSDERGWLAYPTDDGVFCRAIFPSIIDYYRSRLSLKTKYKKTFDVPLNLIKDIRKVSIKAENPYE